MNNSDKTTEIDNKMILTAINDLGKRFDNLETRFDNLETEVSELKIEVSQLKTEVSNLKTEVSDLKTEFSKFKKDTSIQFEVIREGIVYNSTKFDRLDANIYALRSDIFNLKADVKEMNERRGKIEL